MHIGKRVLVHLLPSEWTNKGFDKEGNLWNGHATWKLVEEDI
jgi:hypothetical protein